MNKLLLTLLLFFALGNVSAQSFKGLYSQLGIGYEGISPNYTGSGTMSILGTTLQSSATTTANAANSIIGMATLGYNYEIHRDLIIGLGAEISPLAGQKAQYSTKTAMLGNYNGQYSKQNSYNLFLSPATPLNKDDLLYAKLGYSSALFTDTFNNQSQDIRYSGYLLGLGYKRLISGGFYGYGEINYVKYGNHTIARTPAINISITQTSNISTYNVVTGVGYRF